MIPSDPPSASPVSAPPARIRIFDTSLRDGEQSPGCSMSPAQKLRFAHTLAELGVDVIETGFPASSEADLEATRAIAQAVRGPSLAALARCREDDILSAARALETAAAPRLHVFISTSPLHREHKLGMSRQQVLDSAAEAVRLARRHCDDVEFSAEDALRTEPEFLAEIFSAAVAAGARTLNVPDTVGYATPGEIRALFEYLRGHVQGADTAVFSAHCHNDLGLAVANSLAAIEGGARQVECTVNGIGERAGNCALEELVMALNVRRAHFDAHTGVDTRRLVPASRLLQRLTGMGVQRNKAIVGRNAFAHEAGIHQHGMLRHRGTYEIMNPEDVGWTRSQMVLGRHSGRAALGERLRALGFAVDVAQLDAVFAGFKALAAKKREVFDADLEALLLGGDADAHGYRLLRAHVSTGVAGDGLTTASVCVRDAGGDRCEEAAIGDGPVQALFAALTRATGVALGVDSYEVSSVTRGDDAQGQARVTACVDGVELTGTGTSTDVLEASALAWLEVANRALRKRAATSLPLPLARRDDAACAPLARASSSACAAGAGGDAERGWGEGRRAVRSREPTAKA